MAWHPAKIFGVSVLCFLGAFVGLLGFGLLIKTVAPESFDRSVKERQVAKEKEREIDAAITEDRECSNTSTAFVMAKQFVSDRLKAPSTAKFPYSGATGVSVKYLGNCTHAVAAYVDSQNGFGAMIRTRYSVKVKKERGKDSWTASDLSIED